MDVVFLNMMWKEKKMIKRWLFQLSGLIVATSIIVAGQFRVAAAAVVV